MRNRVAGYVASVVLLSALPAAAGPNVAGSAAGGPRAPAAAPLQAQDTPVSDAARRRVVDGLLRALQDENEAVRARALEALAGMRDERAIPGLLQALSDAREGIRASALEALAQFSTPEAIGGLMIGLKDASPAVRALAARHVSRLIGARPLQNDPQDVEILTGLLLLQDAEPDVRAEAVAGLSRLRRPEAVPSLLPMLQDVDTQVRVETAVALGLLADPRAIDALTAALTDAEPAVREEAARALGLIARGQPRAPASPTRAPTERPARAPGVAGGVDDTDGDRGTAPSAVVPVPPRPPVPSDPPPSPPVPPPASRPAGEAAAPLEAFAGPPPPEPPAVITRNAEGRATIRAVRVREPMRIDGVLDEAHYRDVPSISDFIQIEPNAGQIATEKTEVWLSFDDNNLYVTFRAWDSRMDQLVAREMRRDNAQGIFLGSDLVGVGIDPMFSRRNSVVLFTTPIGARLDGEITNERQFSGDWNPVWNVRAGRFDEGWTAEMAIPFKSLKHRPGAQLWAFNAIRVKRSKNEVSFITRMPTSRGQVALQQTSLAAVVVGMEAPAGSRRLDIKPYATSSLSTDHRARPRVTNDPHGDVGLDVKVGLSDSVNADITVNTDFAQVEADEQQINLTRFSLFFPEKRDFFLENQGTFGFGGVAGGRRGGDTPTLFYSRRIGLQGSLEVPLEVGGRVNGRIGKFIIGALNVQTGDEPGSGALPTNFSVVRIKGDILARSSLGMIATSRSRALSGTGSNQAYGADLTLNFFENVIVNAYWARTRTEGLSGDDISYRAQFDYPADRWGVQLDHLVVGDHFNPEVGFVRRDDMRRTFGEFRFSPRPRADRPITRTIRRFSYTGSIERIEDGDRRLESRDASAAFNIDFQNADSFTVTYTDTFEFLPRPFRIAPGVRLPVGDYTFRKTRVAFNMGQQHRFRINTAAEYGTFYNGHKTTLNLSGGRLGFTPQLSVEPSYSINDVDLVQGSFRTHLPRARVTYTMTPLMFTSALVQYSSSSKAVSTNVRFRWEYSPGSELFLVYNEERDTLTRGPRGLPTLTGRAFIIKINRLFRT